MRCVRCPWNLIDANYQSIQNLCGMNPRNEPQKLPSSWGERFCESQLTWSPGLRSGMTDNADEQPAWVGQQTCTGRPVRDR